MHYSSLSRDPTISLPDLYPTEIRNICIDPVLKTIKVVIPMVSLMCIIFILLCFAKKRDEDGKPYLHRGGSLLR